LDCAAELAHNSRTTTAPRSSNIHCKNDRGRAVDRHRNRETFATERESAIELLHVVDRIDGNATLSDLAEDTISVAVESVERWPVEGSTQSDAALVLSEKMKALIGIFGEAEPGKKARGLLRLRIGSLRCAIHLRIGGIHEREFAGQSVREKITCNFTGIISVR
jgi:hypothetical protein